MRGAVVVFDDSEKLEGALSGVQSSGIDRANLSLPARGSLAQGLSRNAQRLADLRVNRRLTVQSKP